MNWGTKIVIALAIFITAIVSAGIYMVSMDTDTLEESDYYEQGLDFDGVYDRRQNVQKHHAEPEIVIRADTVLIRFVHGMNKGELLLRRPSDKTQDIKIPFVVGREEYRLPVAAFSRGAWHIRLEWEADEMSYWYEQGLFLD